MNYLQLFGKAPLPKRIAGGLWKTTKTLLDFVKPAAIGIWLWYVAYRLFAILGCPYRVIGFLAGAYLFAWAIRRSPRTSFSALITGVLLYFGIVGGMNFGEILFNRGYELETFLDFTLLRDREPLTKWHLVAGAVAAGCCILRGTRRGSASAPAWIENYRRVAGAFLTGLLDLSITLQEARGEQDRGGLDFGMLLDGGRLPGSWATKNFLYAGAIGSGKTTYIRKLMASVLCDLEVGCDRRALVYDLKSEFLPFLQALGPRVPVRIINPLDERCSWWDLAREIQSPKDAYQIANAIIPDKAGEHGSRDAHFFTGKARSIIAGLMISFQRHSPNDWTLSDVCLALRDAKRYQAILKREKDVGSIIASLSHADTAADVTATLDLYRWRFEVIAALWDRAMRLGRPGFTVRDFLSSSQILLVTQDKSGGEILNPVYQALLSTLAEQISSQTNSAARRTWLFLDEFPSLGRVPLIDEVLNTCRTKGAATVIAFQDIEQLRQCYGDHRTNAILAALKLKAIFQSSPVQAKWASEQFGEAEVFCERKSWSSTKSWDKSGGGGSATLNTNTSREKVPLFRPEFFTYLPSPTPDVGFQAGFLLDGRAYHGEEPFFPAIHSVPDSLPDIEGFIPAPAEAQTLEDWTPKDLKRLRITLDESALNPDPTKPKGGRTPVTIKR